ALGEGLGHLPAGADPEAGHAAPSSRGSMGELVDDTYHVSGTYRRRTLVRCGRCRAVRGGAAGQGRGDCPAGVDAAKRGRRRCAAPTPVRSLVERAVVGADRVDLLRRGGGRIELEVQPDLHELLREL